MTVSASLQNRGHSRELPNLELPPPSLIRVLMLVDTHAYRISRASIDARSPIVGTATSAYIFRASLLTATVVLPPSCPVC